MERSVKRPNNLPGKYTDAEIRALKARADRAGLTLAAYIRRSLGFTEPVSIGRPKGSPNRKKEE